jgi:hypothetical protein
LAAEIYTTSLTITGEDLIETEEGAAVKECRIIERVGTSILKIGGVMKHTWRFLVPATMSLAVASAPALAQKLPTMDTTIPTALVSDYVRRNDPALARELTEHNKKGRELAEEIRRSKEALPRVQGTPLYEPSVTVIREKEQELLRLQDEGQKKGEKYRGITGKSIRLYGNWAIERMVEAQVSAVGYMVKNRQSWLGRTSGPVLHVWVDRQGQMKIGHGPPQSSDVGPDADISITPGQVVVPPGSGGGPSPDTRCPSKGWAGGWSWTGGLLGTEPCVPIPVDGKCPAGWTFVPSRVNPRILRHGSCG